MAPGMSEPVTISAEIASTQTALGALVALREGSVPASARNAGSASDFAARRVRPVGTPGSAAQSPRGPTVKQRPDPTWMALEERVAAQVANLQQKHDTEQLDAERVLRASVTRLESRVRALEGQGVRSDRRAAELAGLAQALTEEQRALLIRLDRMEEHTRGKSSRDRDAGAPNEECLRRLHRLEREHRATALNLRLIVSVTEEAQQRSSQRLKSFEELVDGRLRPIEERLHIPTQEAYRNTVREELRAPSLSAALHGSRGLPDGGGGSASTPGSFRPEYTAHGERRPHGLEAAQQLLRRCEVGTNSYPGEPVAHLGGSLDSQRQGSLDSHRDSHRQHPGQEDALESLEALRMRLEPDGLQEIRARVNELGSSLCPRTDAVEARVRALADAMEELRKNLDAIAAHTQVLACEPRAAQQPELSQFARRELEAVTRRNEANEAGLLELRGRFERLATHEQVAAACREAQTATARTEELRACVDRHTSNSESIAKSIGLHASALEQLRRETDALTVALEGHQRRLARAPELEVPGEEVANLGRKLEEQRRAQETSVLELRQLAQEQAALLAELRARPAVVPEVTAADIAEVREASAGHAAAITELRRQLPDVASAVEAHVAVASAHGVAISELQGVADQRRAQESAIAELRQQAQDQRRTQEATLQELHGQAQDHRRAQEATIAELRQQAQEQSTVLADFRAQLHARGEEHASVLSELRSQLRARASREEQDTALEAKLEALGEQRAQELRSRLDEVAREGKELRSRVEDAASASKTDAAVPRVAALEEAVVEMRKRLLELPMQDQLLAAMRPQARQLEALEDVRMRVEEVSHASRAGDEALRRNVQAHNQELLEIHERLQQLARPAAAFEPLATAGPQPTVPEEEDFVITSVDVEVERPDLEAAIHELKSKCGALQETVDQKVLLPLWRVERQVPEALEKVDHLLRDYPDRIAKVEENDIRLGIALSRFATHEQKVQGCMERLERVPNPEQIKKMCREELWKRLEETDVQGLNHSVDLQARAIEELSERLQEVCDVVCYGGDPPDDELAVRQELAAQKRPVLRPPQRPPAVDGAS